MRNNNIFKVMDLLLLFFTICIFVSCIMLKIYDSSFLGVYLLFISIYLCIKCSKNKKIFFIFITLFYFNFSVVISRYIGEPSNLMNGVYDQLENESSMIIGIMLQIVFLVIINMMIGTRINTPQEENLLDSSTNSLNFRYRKILIFLLQAGLVLILGYHIFFNITVATTLLEYSIFLFIFALYFSKNDKKNRIITEIILLLFTIYSLKNGDRIGILQLILADFIINYIDKIKTKQILIIMIIGILAFTLFGLYGDFLIYKQDFKNLTLEYTIDQIKDRRFALDTSVSAYFTGVSMIDLSENYEKKEKIKDGMEYFTKYTLMGSKSGYVHVEYKIKSYQTNYGGGFLTCRFYYWFNWIGVMLISFYVGILIKRVIMKPNNLYKSLLSIFLISTIPRWYLYDPSLLFRGIILYSIFYYIISKIFIKKD